MRAVVCKELGALDALTIEEQPDLVPGRGQVVVDVKAAGVNYVDGLMAQGRYQIKPATPYTPGGEVAGRVSAIGDGVEGVAIDDPVLVMTGAGGFASQVVVRAADLLTIPGNLDLPTAAALIQSYATALFTLARRTTVAPGEWVLVTGAGGGIGLASVDVAKAMGAQVIAAASSDEKLAAARAIGADATINYEIEDLKVRARELSGGGVDVVLDPVGGKYAEPALRATKFNGRFCVVGFTAGIPSVPLNLVLLNNRTLIGVEWGGWVFRDPEGNKALVQEILDMIGDGKLHPAAPAERPLDDAAQVMADLLERRVAGKVVLIP